MRIICVFTHKDRITIVPPCQYVTAFLAPRLPTRKKHPDLSDKNRDLLIGQVFLVQL